MSPYKPQLILTAVLIAVTILFAVFNSPLNGNNDIQVESEIKDVSHPKQLISKEFAMQVATETPTAPSTLRTIPSPIITESPQLVTSESAEVSIFPPAFKLENQKRLGILTIHTPEYYKWSPLAIKNKIDYANKHNYRFYVEHGKSDNRHPVWSKISSLIQRMTEESHEWYWALDLDTVIMNFTIPADIYLDDKYDVIVVKDCNGYNAGSFFIKNSEWSLSYLKNGKSMLMQYQRFPNLSHRGLRNKQQ
jgi:hypothetical protein